MNELRLPFFILAALALLVAVLIELGSVAILGAAASSLPGSTPGWSIGFLACIDLILLYTISVMGAGIIFPRAIEGRIQGIVSLIVSFLGLIATIVLIFTALALLLVMVTLLLAIPFGTLAYLAVWGHFPTGEAAATLGLIMFLKLAFCVLLLLAEQRFLQNKGLIILTGASLGATWLAGFLIAFPPSILASITDMIAALIFSIVGAVWLLVMLIGSLLAIIASLRTVRV